MNSIIKDILYITKDYLLYSKDIKKIEQVVFYVLSILENIYDKKIISKYIYFEIVEQIISKEFPYLNKNYKFIMTKNRRKYLKSRIKCLQNKPQYEQRSIEWHEQRKNSIGASELASIFNKNPFLSYNKFLLKKIQFNEESINEKQPNKLNIYCQHGIKYENVVQMIYCNRNNIELLEFGSIEDENYKWLRASPDGITTKGTMLEIKVPLSREIFGLPPINYWYQIQQQLKVCKLNECDFLECKIEEYSSWNQFIKDTYDNKIYLSNNNLEKGVIIEYININEENPWNRFGYIYPESLKLSLEEIYMWNMQNKMFLDKSENRKYIRIIPWKLIKYSCIKIYRNRSWWKNNFNIIEIFWNSVINYRNNGYKHLIKEYKPKNKKELFEYSFLSDD